MEKIFEHCCPCMKYELTKKNIKEFQIRTNVSNEFLESFYENNKKTFLETVYLHIKLNHSSMIKQQGIDFHYNDSNIRIPHIYILLDLNDNTNKNIDTIITDLHNEYQTNWMQYRVPRLMTIIKTQMKDNEIFQQALKSYKNNHNSINTETMIHVLSNQILWYYDDISFLINRNRYDFK